MNGPWWRPHLSLMTENPPQRVPELRAVFHCLRWIVLTEVAFFHS